MFYLTIYHAGEVVHRRIPVEGIVTVGRDPSNVVVLSDAGISRRHAAFEACADGNTLLVRDLGSRNGTFVDGRRIQRQEVRVGGEIVFGSWLVRVCHAEKEPTLPVREDDDHTVVFSGNPFAAEDSSTKRMKLLYDLALNLADLEIPEVLETSAALIRESLEFDTLCIFLEGKRQLLLSTAWNKDGPCGTNEVLLSRSVLNHCLKTKEPVISEKLAEDRRFRDAPSVTVQGVQSAVCVPILSGSQTLGALYCCTCDPIHAYSAEDLQFLMLIGSHVGFTISQKRMMANVAWEHKKLDKVLQNLRDGMLVCDSSFRVLLANRAAGAILLTEEVVGKDLAELLAPFDHTFDSRLTCASGSFSFERHTQDREATRELKAYQASLSAMPRLQSEDSAYSICIRDVSETRRNEQLKSLFVSQLTHKLASPLNAINGASSLIRKRLGQAGLDKKSSELLDMCQEGCQDMKRIVHRFSELAALSITGKQRPISDKGLPLLAAVEESLAQTRAQVLQSGLTVEVDDSLRNLALRVHRDLLTASFSQLIQNAAKFAGQDATLSIGAILDDNAVSIAFTDNGPGVPDDKIESVFGIFQQIDNDETGQIPGIGLGLWWSRHMIRSYGGEVSIESPPESHPSGTKVLVILPRHLATVAPAEVSLDTVQLEFP